MSMDKMTAETTYRELERQRDRRRRANRRKRNLQLRARMTALAAVCIFLSCLSASTIFSRAQTEHADIARKYFTSIQIQSGDTLYSIACRYADDHYDSIYDYMKEVCLTNHLTEDALNEGAYLIVPRYGTEYRH